MATGEGRVSFVQGSVRYDLALDPGRLISRAIFDETKNCTLTGRKTLGLGDHCETVKLLLPVRIWVWGQGLLGEEPRLTCWEAPWEE